MKRAVAVLLALLLAGACTSGTGTEPSGPTVLTVDDSVRPLTVGEDYRVVWRVATRLDGRGVSLAGWTSDGTEVYVRRAESADGDPRDDDPYAVALVARDPESGRTTVISDRAARQGPVARDRIPGDAVQIVSVAVIRDLVVWVEASGLTHGDLFVHDVSTGTERRLVRSTALATGATPLVHDEHVYFVGVDGEDLDATPARTSVYRVPADGSAEPELVARDAIDVFGDESPMMSANDDVLRMVFEDRVVGWDPDGDGELPGTALPADCGAFGGDGVTIACDGASPELTIDTGDARFVVRGVRGTIGGLHSTARWAAFTVDRDGRQEQYVFDAAREDLRRVPATRVLHGLRTHSSFLGLLRSRRPSATEPVIELVR